MKARKRKHDKGHWFAELKENDKMRYLAWCILGWRDERGIVVMRELHHILGCWAPKIRYLKNDE